MDKIKFEGSLLILGFGAVSQCTLPLLLKKIDINPKNINIIDMIDKSDKSKEYSDKGINFHWIKLTKENLYHKLSTFLIKGDMLIDLSWEIDTCELIKWCHLFDVLYINTALEWWPGIEGINPNSAEDCSLYARHMKLREMVKSYGEGSPTAIIDHGANPGLVS